MNNKAHLRPKDFDSNGDIIPMACKEEKVDLISRSALKVAIEKELDKANLTEYEACICVTSIYDRVIDNAPTVDISGNEYFPYRTAYFNGVADGRATARPKGEWIFKHNSSDIWCSVCDMNFEEIPQNFKFCPNCGADMRGGAE